VRTPNPRIHDSSRCSPEENSHVPEGYAVRICRLLSRWRTETGVVLRVSPRETRKLLERAARHPPSPNSKPRWASTPRGLPLGRGGENPQAEDRSFVKRNSQATEELTSRFSCHPPSPDQRWKRSTSLCYRVRIFGSCFLLEVRVSDVSTVR
jgi:hypothetical protein